MSTIFNTLPFELNHEVIDNIQIHHKDSDKLSETSTNSQQAGQLFNTKLKRSLCRNYMMHGYCPYGYKCQFAHGTEQLQCNVNEKNNYKTKICIAFVKKGFCSYGERCNFIHKTSMTKKNCKTIYQNFGQIFRQQKYQNMANLGKSPLLTMLTTTDSPNFNQQQYKNIFPSLNSDQISKQNPKNQHKHY